MAGPGLGYEILGAVKVKDGLFVGDELAAQDLGFVDANKVKRVINCCGRQVPNHWQSIGVAYLTYYWADVDTQTILDPCDEVANEVFRFVEEALEVAESILIHSVRGQSRSCCLLAAYIMKKYHWGLRKTMEFLSSRRPDVNLKPAFLQQLSGYERRLAGTIRSPFSNDWNGVDYTRLDCDEFLLRNTYINSQMGPLAEFHVNENSLPAKTRKLVWADNSVDDKIRLEKPAGADRHNLQSIKRAENGQPMLKCIIKTKIVTGCGNNTARAEQQNGASRLTNAIGDYPADTRAPVNEGAMQAAAGGILAGKTVPIAWAAENEAPAASQAYSGNGAVRSCSQRPNENCQPPLSGGYPSSMAGAAPPKQTSPSSAVAKAAQPGGVPASHVAQSAAPQRGPATNIRDSLSGLPMSRRESSEGGSRPASRDPSPKTSVSRRESPMPRGESPLRLLSRSGAQRSNRAPSPAGGSVPGGAAGSRQSMGSAPPSVNNLGFSMGGVRNSGAPQRGMGAFRSGGPVRAKADLLGDSNPLQRSRPVATPSGARSSGSRAASPLRAQQRSGSGSRQASPQARAPSPGTSQYDPRASISSAPATSSCQLSNLDRQKHRSIMRRAPSPTPAFNRNPSPSRPRWRN
eukprot:TRINITY_DN43320_c0_g1_i1.p1 TRINITY_DN43320_c0_g1~~TRINITY_DN43320_c0_g1_i1.p1  ORF type:complete len:661 (-),score=60.84 TRINITY_DN43320_c0_g1_i1:69-1961(-)